MSKRALLSCFVFVATLVATGPASAKGEPRAQRPLRVLFVGNSYTYVNDLPWVVAVVAATRGIEVDFGMLAEPNFALEDHIRTGAYDAKLAEGWDFVVLQQGPSSLPQNREHLRVWSVRAATSARERGTRVVLFSAWPARDNLFTWMDAEESYQLAARAAGGCIAPVATAWRYARAAHPDVDVYSGDDLHASLEGTLLAAHVMVRAFIQARFAPQAPDMREAIEDPLWRTALARSDMLDAMARRAVDDIEPRCSLAKRIVEPPLRARDVR
ncbi:MAG TPA: hypothetical protein VFL14_08180 [Xanthomonadales bacterium]|nr:hypothetical protein [Xanthomonadales bacterium]